MDTRTSPMRMRLAQLREELARHGVHALLVPSSDPHLSEYLPERWQGRVWLSGFTGSMGTLVVGSERAALFADSRYWVQAESQLAGTGIELVRIDSAASPAHLDWLVEQVPRGGVVAVDGQVLGLAAAQALQGRLDAAGITLRTDARPAGRHLARSPGPARAAGVRAPRTACAATARRQAGAGARGDGAPRRHASLHLHRRRHRLAQQPARQRRRLQPGVPGAPAAARHRRHAVRRPGQDRRGACATSWRPTASPWRPTSRRAQHWPRWAPARCC